MTPSRHSPEPPPQRDRGPGDDREEADEERDRLDEDPLNDDGVRLPLDGPGPELVPPAVALDDQQPVPERRVRRVR